MPRIGFIVAALFVIAAAVLAFEIEAYQLGYFGSATTSESVPPPHPLGPHSLPPVKPLPDADLLANRFPKTLALYQGTRDAALAAYASSHPQPRPSDDEARQILKIVCYLAVNGDFYGECLWQQVGAEAHILRHSGDPDPAWPALCNAYTFQKQISSNDSSALEASQETFAFGASAYPPLLKFIVYKTQLRNLIASRGDTITAQSRSLADLPKLADGAVQNFAQLLALHPPHDFLYYKASDLFSALQDDEPTLISANDGIAKAFATTDPTNPVASAILGDFYVSDAWNARGSGEANTVTPEGWRLFGDRLTHAENILTDAYANNPDEATICRVMMTVCLGRQEPQDQMELWFQRGIKADPDSYSIYMAKRYYLLPRWYGSDEIVWNFGLECAASTNWSAKIPLVLVEAIDDRAENDPTVYADPGIWGPVEKVFRGYLDHYPDALSYRTRFFQCAVQGSHWDVANEQLKIMNGDWDRSLLHDSEMASLAQQAKAHAIPGH